MSFSSSTLVYACVLMNVRMSWRFSMWNGVMMITVGGEAFISDRM